MLSYKVKIGLVPIRREGAALIDPKKDVRPEKLGNFNPWWATDRGAASVRYIEEHYTGEHVSFVDIDGINTENLLFTEKDVPAVVARLKEAEVDAIMLINTNFGNEEVAGFVAREIGKPVLLWGPQDDYFGPNGERYTDTQCGLFGMSRMLQRLNIPFSYIENCKIEDEKFDKGFRKFVSVACMVKNFTNLRIAQVGMRPKSFCSVIVNEGELMQKFGIQIIPVNLALFKSMFDENLEKRRDELEALKKEIAGKFDLDEMSKDNLDKIACFVLTYEDIHERFNVAAVSAECWTAMGRLVGCSPCSSYSILADRGYILGCESDIHATITQVLLKSAMLGEKIPFLGEFTARHPENPNAELLWHCGPFAWSLHQDDAPCKIVGGRSYLHVGDGHYSLARMDQDNGNYSILVGEFDSVPGPYTFGTYVWGEFSDLDKWERKLIEGPYIHHMSEIEGSLTEVFKEFVKYVPNLSIDLVD